MDRILRKLSTFSFKQKGLSAFGLGALLALAQAPVYFFPLIFISFTGLLYLTDGDTPLNLKQSFGLGWLFGLGYHVLGLYWIAFALRVDMAQFWWLIPFAVLGLPAFIALQSGVALLLLRLSRVEGLAKAFLFVCLWSMWEMLRGSLFTGFPWNLVGYTWLFSLPMVQITSIIGIYGLTALTILLGVLPYIFFKHRQYGDSLAVLCLFLGIGVYGLMRLSSHPTQYQEAIHLRLVQPNISQTLKWDRDRATDNYMKLLALSSTPSSSNITHVIWPESAIPYYLNENTWRREEIMSRLPEGATLITGGLRRQFEGRSLTHIWNSLLVIDPSKKVVASYDKSHLVPFGEYVPFRRWAPRLFKKITHGSLDFTPGPGPQTVRLEGTPAFSPLICYEGIFPRKVVGEIRPHWMINITNDAWYGNTSGPYQHFGITRMRAIEQGIPLVRVANSGISAIFDAYGRILHKLNLNETGILDARLPKAHPVPSFYARYKDLGFWVILALLGLRILFITRKEYKKKEPTVLQSG